MPKRGGLNRGMDYLFERKPAAQPEGAPSSAPQKLRISLIEPNREQPRRNFEESELAELADSIRRYGVIQPVLVRPMPNGPDGYQLVAGERRWRAARLAGVSEIPAQIKDLDDREVAEIGLVENLQRSDLNPIEEAEGYQTLMKKYGYTQEETAERVGRSRPAVANALRLLQLSPELLELVENKSLSAGHARALLSLPGSERMKAAKRVIAEGLSVRQAEALSKPKRVSPPQKPPHFCRELEVALKESLGRQVTVTANGKGKGRLVISFQDENDLRELAKQLS